MRPRRSFIAAALVTAVTTSSAQDPRMTAEIARVAAGVVMIPEANRQAVIDRLERAKKALAAGETYLSLYELQIPFEMQGGFERATAEKFATTVADFRTRWEQLGAPSAPPAQRASIAFVEALAQSAEVRAPATYHASLPYARDAGVPAGFYYLGESHAMERFAAFARSLPLKVSQPALPLRSIEPVLSAFERDVVKAFDGTAEANRPRFIGVNVAIKLARTLDEQKRYEGALLQYLVARYRFAMAQPVTAAPAADAVAVRLLATRIPPGADHSIGEFFRQLASAANAGPDPGPRGAAAILDDVLPAYFAALEAPKATTAAPAAAPVTITFIRWPFT